MRRARRAALLILGSICALFCVIGTLAIQGWRDIAGIALFGWGAFMLFREAQKYAPERRPEIDPLSHEGGWSD